MKLLLAGIWMSLAWSLRGQFGHLKGALIPGAFAAIFIALAAPHEKWRRAFPLAVILGSLGFSVGGHMSYGKIVNTIIESPELVSVSGDLLRIFIMGGIWGGLGASLLGLGFCEKKVDFKDVIRLGLLLAFWYLLLAKLHLRKYGLIGFGTMMTYNLSFKQSRVIGHYSFAGFFGFGIGFLFAVLVLWAGRRGFFPGEWAWWALRDQILGFIGGISLHLVSKILFIQKVVPAVFPGRWLSRTGFFWLLIYIPGINIKNVLSYWLKSGHFPGEGILIAAVFILLFFSPVIWTFIRSQWVYPPGLSAIWPAGLFLVWFLSFLAIAKETVVLGAGRWETAYSLFLVYSVFISAGVFFQLASAKQTRI